MAAVLPICLVAFVLCLLSIHADARQCYKCGCFIQEGDRDCKLNCTIQFLENSYCDVRRTPGELEIGHGPVSVLTTSYRSLHFLRATEVITYDADAGRKWQPAKMNQITYGCDWDLCNNPEILKDIPTTLSFAIDHEYLSDALIDTNPDAPATCKSCTKCVTASSDPPCPEVACPSGTCIIDDHAVEPEYNGECNATYVASCQPPDVELEIMARITGTYYLDDGVFQVNELDLNCRKTNCNDPAVALELQKKISYIEVDSTLFTRPKNSDGKISHISQPLLFLLTACIGYFSL